MNCQTKQQNRFMLLLGLLVIIKEGFLFGAS